MFTNRLPKNANHFLAILSANLPPQTYLAGGTCLALHLNHCDSYDLDFYSPDEFNVDEIGQRWQADLPDFKLLSTSWQTIIGQVKETEISLFYYLYPLLEPTTKLKGISLASVADIAAMKLEAIAGRGMKRDFFDLYCICQQPNWSLSKTIDLNQQKYNRQGSNLPHLLKSLTYFKDAENKPERASEVEREWTKVKQFFLQEAPPITKRFLS